MLVLVLLGSALAIDGCGLVDTTVPAASGPCTIAALNPDDPSAGLASGGPCVILTWDTTRFPSALTNDGGVGDPLELRGAADAAGYPEAHRRPRSVSGAEFGPWGSTAAPSAPRERQ